MATWKSAVNGAWTTASNWDTGAVPGPGESAFVSIAGSYTIALNANIATGSLTISDPGAYLSIVDPGGIASFSGDLSNAGVLGLDADNYTAEGGSSLSIAGTLTDTGSIAPRWASAPTIANA